MFPLFHSEEMSPTEKQNLGIPFWGIYCLIIFMLFSFFVFPAMGQSQITNTLIPVDPKQVKAGGVIEDHLEKIIENNFLQLNIDNDFLYQFKQRRNGENFIGLGLLIDSLVHAVAKTNDKRLLDLKDYVIEETLRTQEVDGYIGIFLPKRRYKTLWDISEMAYLILGLSSDYHYFQQDTSLNAATKLADHLIDHWGTFLKSMSVQNRFTQEMATVGLEEALLQLYKETGERQYLDFCTDILNLPEWDQEIILGRFTPVKGHAFAYLNKCFAQIQLYHLQPDLKLLQQTNQVLNFLINQDGMVITGTCGKSECWHNNQDGTSALGETCATTYLIRLLDEMIRITGDLRYGDIMERAIYNSLFAAQSHDGRQIRYFTPFEGPRVYYKYDTYCCPGNYRRIIAELPRMIYYTGDGGLTLNLYTDSEVNIKLEKGVFLHVKQETHYPKSGKVTIRLKPSKAMTFPVKLRIPQWCKKATVFLNGELLSEIPDGETTFIYRRLWQVGDCMELHMPMTWRLIKGRKVQAGRVAVMRGPIIFGLNRTYNKKVEDLRTLTLDPLSLRGPIIVNKNGSGLACMARGWKKIGFTTGEYPELFLFLTEFTDPGCEMIYFNVHRMDSVGEKDELLGSLNSIHIGMP